MMASWLITRWMIVKSVAVLIDGNQPGALRVPAWPGTAGHAASKASNGLSGQIISGRW